MLIVLNVSQRPSGFESDGVKLVSIATVIRFSRKFLRISFCDLLQNGHIVLPTIKAVNFPDSFPSGSGRAVGESRPNHFIYAGTSKRSFMPDKNVNHHAQSWRPRQSISAGLN
jgi:hypothetical protein